MVSSNKITGNLGEALAEKYLIDIGYIVLDRNFRYKTGEIDLICKDGDCITFVEVKARKTNRFGEPCEAVTPLKQLKIYKTAEVYIMKKKLYKYDFRFDVLEVIILNDDDYSIKLIKDAFQI